MSPPPSLTLCKKMRFWRFQEFFLLEPLDNACSETLCISKPDGKISFIKHPPPSPPPLHHPLTVFGLLGIIELLAGPYLILATQREVAGSLRGHPVYRLKGAQIVACAGTQKLTSRQKRDERLYLKSLKTALFATGLFFSYETDITTSCQKAIAAGPERAALPLWKQATPQFVFNGHLLDALVSEQGMHPFLLPLMQGNILPPPSSPQRSFQTLTAVVEGKEVDVALVGRRGTQRIGTRMWRRGADGEGGVANFVESEQILAVDSSLASYVQVRGSIPLHWEQVVDLTYKPKMQYLGEEGKPPLEKHFRQVAESYGSVVAVDLIKQTGGESKLGKVYANQMGGLNNPKIGYVAFDLHEECGHMDFGKMEKLYTKLEGTLSEQGYLLSNLEGESLQPQRGVVRTNCIDCLDRTNVTQSGLGRKTLEAQLRSLHVLGGGGTIKDHPELDTKFNILWADHGDDISVQYSGTGALKGDFVRYGKRSVHGLLQDGLNSVMRYYRNNFVDGTRQDGLELVMGHYVVNPAAPSPFVLKGVELYASLPAASLLLVAGVYLSLSSLGQMGREDRPFAMYYGVSWAAFVVGIAYGIKTFGRLFCDRPRLSPVKLTSR